VAEILATYNDINAFLPVGVVLADDDNAADLQIAIARVVRGNLSSIFTPLTLAAWADPDSTPDYIREVAAKLIAAHLYKKLLAQNVTEVGDRHYAQRLYDEGMAMLMNVQAGVVDLGIPGDEPTAILTTADFFPIDDTDRAFTMKMEL
jgi:hypothetical protein